MIVLEELILNFSFDGLHILMLWITVHLNVEIYFVKEWPATVVFL